MEKLIYTNGIYIITTNDSKPIHGDFVYSLKPVYGSGGKANLLFVFDERINYSNDFGDDNPILKLIGSENKEHNVPLLLRKNIDEMLAAKEDERISNIVKLNMGLPNYLPYSSMSSRMKGDFDFGITLFKIAKEETKGLAYKKEDLSAFLEYVRDNYTGVGAPHLVHNKGGQRKTAVITEEFVQLCAQAQVYDVYVKMKADILYEDGSNIEDATTPQLTEIDGEQYITIKKIM